MRDVLDTVERELVEHSEFDRAPESWHVLFDSAAPRARGRWLETDGESKVRPVYAETATTDPVFETLVDAVSDLTEHVSTDKDRFPVRQHDLTQLTIDRRCVKLVPTDEKGWNLVVRYAIENKFTHEAANEEIYEALVSELPADGQPSENLPDSVARFDAGVLSQVSADIDGRRAVLFAEETNTQLHRLLEEAVLDYAAVIDAPEDARVYGETFAFDNTDGIYTEQAEIAVCLQS